VARFQKNNRFQRLKRRIAVYKLIRLALVIALALAAITATSAQTKSFTPVEGASLRAKIDNAIAQGRANAPILDRLSV